uniref:Zinc finger protein 75D n=1 Tax=Nomascus leucogenys TaxID=61853 RepID=A0A2I3GSK6_NOMLE
MITRELKADACLNPHMGAMWETNRSVKENSSQSKKYSTQIESLGPGSAHRHSWSFHYHEATEPLEVINQLQKLCHQWLRPEIHSKKHILEMLILEQFLTILPKGTQNWVQKHHPQHVKQALVLVERLQREPGGTKNEITAHELGEEAMLLGGTTVAPGFKWKPADLEPMEYWNTYRVLQEQLGWNTHKETQPVYERAVHVQQILALSEHKITKDWKIASKLICPESQSLLTFEDTAMYFSEEEWQLLDPLEKTLYNDVMQDIYETAISLTLKLKNDTGNDYPIISVSASEIQTAGYKVSKKNRMNIAQKTKGRENHGDTHRVQKWHQEEKKLTTCKQELPKLMDLHGKGHTGEKPFKCQDCGKIFRVSSDLIKHQRIHTEEKLYKCQQCDRRFRWSSGLNKHFMTHQGINPHRCLWCGKSFSYDTNLQTHQRIHTGEKLFKCHGFGKIFIHKSHLIKYQRTHTGEQPYTCSICRRNFSRHLSLLRYQKLHRRWEACPMSPN